MKETLNLLPGREKARPRHGIAFYIGIAVCIYLVTIVGLGIANKIKARKLDSVIAGLNIKRENLIKGIRPAEPSLPAVPAADRQIDEMIKKSPPWDVILSEVSVIVPDKVWLGLMDITEQGGGFYMSIKGFSKEQVSVAEFISRLEGSPYFTDVNIVFSQKVEKDVAFELKVRIQWT